MVKWHLTYGANKPIALCPGDLLMCDKEVIEV